MNDPKCLPDSWFIEDRVHIMPSYTGPCTGHLEIPVK